MFFLWTEPTYPWTFSKFFCWFTKISKLCILHEADSIILDKYWPWKTIKIIEKGFIKLAKVIEAPTEEIVLQTKFIFWAYKPTIEWIFYLESLINILDSDEKYWTNFLNFRQFSIQVI